MKLSLLTKLRLLEQLKRLKHSFDNLVRAYNGKPPLPYFKGPKPRKD